MKTYIKFNMKKGETKKSICQDIARHMWQYFRLIEMDGKIGEENTAVLDDIKKELSSFMKKKGYVKIEDMMNIDRYQLFLERQMRQVITKLIDPTEGNTLFIPGLLNNPYKGYFIAKNKKEIQEIYNFKKNNIDGCLTNLDHRTIEARRYLTSGRKEELRENIEVG